MERTFEAFSDQGFRMAADSLRRRRALGVFAALRTVAPHLTAARAPASGIVSADTSCPCRNGSSSSPTPFFEILCPS